MAASAAAEKPAEAAAKPAEAAAGGGGVKALLPLILNIVLMPAIAFAMTQFVILPKLNSKASAHAEAGAEGEGAEAEGGHGEEKADKGHGEEKADKGHGEAKADKGHGEAKADKGHGEEKADKGHGEAKPSKSGKTLAPLPSRLIVNVAGTMGTRFLAVGITLVGKKSSIKDLVEENADQLKDAISSALSSKTTADLERPGARNLIRSELITISNNILGEGVVTDLYFTEFAIQ